MPKIREEPFRYIDDSGEYNVFVPEMRENSGGPSWTNGTPDGSSVSLADFFVAKPGDSAATINAALDQGKNLLFTPVAYHLDEAIDVSDPNRVVLALGLVTLVPENGNAAIRVGDVDGVKLAGLLIDAGARNSAELVEIGPEGSNADHADTPTSLQDVFFRVGGAHVGRAYVSLDVNSSDVTADHLWLWRADHGSGSAPSRTSSTTGQPRSTPTTRPATRGAIPDDRSTSRR
ncbi:hypothetical protein CDG81_09295 [Actinopolyspora erythraea]|uniref:Uncharacterized protein n=1 Tax=Actinopolyspora erythraea TaxID=414996 RepID=A0A223RRE7_9ACTN|nr:hypothetical protein [Actinopolyspora erythraea]ASU78441.1 hypothetical protein CDG81_09295 [Actinopolyspora erythraea]